VTFTKDEKAMLEFAMRYPYKWHTFALDAKTLKAVSGLCRKIDRFDVDMKTSMFRYSMRVNK
jgi:hypothetical protein